MGLIVIKSERWRGSLWIDCSIAALSCSNDSFSNSTPGKRSLVIASKSFVSSTKSAEVLDSGLERMEMMFLLRVGARRFDGPDIKAPT
jgi:hypothetical protein